MAHGQWRPSLGSEPAVLRSSGSEAGAMKRLVISLVIAFIVIRALARGCGCAAADGRQGETCLGLRFLAIAGLDLSAESPLTPASGAESSRAKDWLHSDTARSVQLRACSREDHHPEVRLAAFTQGAAYCPQSVDRQEGGSGIPQRDVHSFGRSRWTTLTEPYGLD